MKNIFCLFFKRSLFFCILSYELSWCFTKLCKDFLLSFTDTTEVRHAVKLSIKCILTKLVKIGCLQSNYNKPKCIRYFVKLVIQMLINPPKKYSRTEVFKLRVA